MKLIKYLSLLVLAILISGCAPTKVEDQFKGMTSEQIFAGGEKNMAKHKYDVAIKYFEGLETLYPFGPNAQQAQMDLIYAYYRNGDSALALAAADRYIHLYPTASDVDYAYYMKGLVNYDRSQSWLQRKFKSDVAENDLTDYNLAFVNFTELLQRFPNSKYAPDAQKRMVYIRNLMAQHELESARFYMVHKAYVAAANRATYIVEHFQGSPQVVDALVILVKANRALGLNAQANNALRVLQLNYPNSPQFKKLQ